MAVGGGAAVVAVIVIIAVIMKNKKKNDDVNAKLNKLLSKQSAPPRGLPGGKQAPMLGGPTANQRPAPGSGGLPRNQAPGGMQGRPGPGGMPRGPVPGQGNSMNSMQPPRPATPGARPGAGAQKPGMQKVAPPPPPKIEVNAPPRSLAPKKK